jgi:hypothetical protein
MASIIAWVTEHWLEVVGVWGAISYLASWIVKWTPTLKDDNIVLPIIKFVSKYIANNRTVDDAAVRESLKK